LNFTRGTDLDIPVTDRQKHNQTTVCPHLRMRTEA